MLTSLLSACRPFHFFATLSYTLFPSLLSPSSLFLFFSSLFHLPSRRFFRSFHLSFPSYSLFLFFLFTFFIPCRPLSHLFTFLAFCPFPFYPPFPALPHTCNEFSICQIRARVQRLSHLNATTSSAFGKASRHHSMFCRARYSSRALTCSRQPLPDSPTCHCRLES